MTTAPTLLAGDVAVGDRLPDLAVDVTPRTVVMGASASRDWQPQHHDHRHCVDVANLPDIFLNTPNQAGFFERYLTDWGGPHARLGRLRFRMRRTVIPGDRMAFSGTVLAVGTDDNGTAWVDVDVTLRVGDEVATECQARLALPASPDDTPWRHRGAAWTPTALPDPDPAS
jgi:acyl dehydratase